MLNYTRTWINRMTRRMDFGSSPTLSEMMEVGSNLVHPRGGIGANRFSAYFVPPNRYDPSFAIICPSPAATPPELHDIRPSRYPTLPCPLEE